jgi:hypothetical protein
LVSVCSTTSSIFLPIDRSLDSSSTRDGINMILDRSIEVWYYKMDDGTEGAETIRSVSTFMMILYN